MTEENNIDESLNPENVPVVKKKATRKRVAKKSRAQTQRSTDTLREERNDLLWVEGNNLPNIAAREGMTQRWVRTKTNGNDDEKNLWKRQNQGWEPRKYSTIPKGQYVPKINFDGDDIVGMHDMVLMERSIELHERYHNIRRNDVRLQQRAIDNDVMKFHDAESGLRSRQSGIDSQVHMGRVPTIAPDD